MTSRWAAASEASRAAMAPLLAEVGAVGAALGATRAAAAAAAAKQPELLEAKRAAVASREFKAAGQARFLALSFTANPPPPRCHR